ncbi:unnamed protein product [Candida verbasci]|uniref:N-acetyltransferase domain-containing protein n=1 Tax=Candida verbasci TaxID=1227364 RepID=A0A9W4TPR9_9ASCO|nr:unnamed protein product [Candida verbasci]
MGRDIIALDDLTINNVGVLKKINEVTVGTNYPQSWYDSILKSSDSIVKLAYYSEIPIGGMKAKTFNNSQSKSNFQEVISSNISNKTPNCVYIESFAILKAYQSLGVGSKLLTWLIEETKSRFIHEIIVHLHTDNKKAIEWFEKKGFKQLTEIKDYYKDQGLENPDAYLHSLTV